MAFFPDTRIKVKPIVFYPKGVAHDPQWIDLWQMMLTAARHKYKRMLKQRDTFALDPLVLVIDGALSIAEYSALTHRQGAPDPDNTSSHVQPNGILTILAEVLQHPFFSAYSRYTLPYCLPILLVDPGFQWPEGGGHNLNGGLNRGGGVTVISTRASEEFQRLQSTLLHEIGHTFGLTHTSDRVWAKGYQMDAAVYECIYDRWHSPSVMSYNPRNWSNSMEVDDIPGCLIADDIDTLCFNRLAFPDLFFDKEIDFDCPSEGATIQHLDEVTSCPDHDRTLRRLADHPWDMSMMASTNLVWHYTESGSDAGTQVTHLSDSAKRYIPANSASAPLDKIQPHVWLSKKASANSWATVEVTFPIPVTLDRMLVYSQHGGNQHRVEQIQVKSQAQNGLFKILGSATAATANTAVNFSPTTARVWQVRLRSGSSGQVAVRGIRYFHGGKEWFPPEEPAARTDSGETFGSHVSSLVAVQRTIRMSHSSVGWDPATMWHSGPVNELGWVALEVVFPAPMALDTLHVYSGHSGNLHQAKQVQVQILNGGGTFEFIHQQPVNVAQQIVNFPRRIAQVWKFAFQGAPGGFVVVRGLRFFDDQREWYPVAVVE